MDEPLIDETDAEVQPTMATMDEETANVVIAEINRREALGLPGVPGGDWDD
ncbi:hypothetical protein STRTUCAR8_08595 [Streptomyces turgidiscabies Car8]|uniref:Uncharacterized protein n=1 Tax=Streptomyces turgidiscabies (strain Car8) TaxID=698760 RepID=L7F984_STRT8|nr:hypothetical protein [Streptomyces turgidiscabies]ELP67674.1 hypothetical protein STRTUCAR8_08595 [Streptomyces turgidiscabies Car8]